MKKILFLICAVLSLNVFSQQEFDLNQFELLVNSKQHKSVIEYAFEKEIPDTLQTKVNFYLGKSYHASYKFFDALQFYSKALEEDSLNVVIENSMAEIHETLGQPPLSSKIINQYRYRKSQVTKYIMAR